MQEKWRGDTHTAGAADQRDIPYHVARAQPMELGEEGGSRGRGSDDLRLPSNH